MCMHVCAYTQRYRKIDYNIIAVFIYIMVGPPVGVSIWLSFTLHVLNMHTQLLNCICVHSHMVIPSEARLESGSTWWLFDIVDNPTKVALSTLYTEALWKITSFRYFN